MELAFKEANVGHASVLGAMNKRLIEDENHSNPMNVEQLIARMRSWLQNGYSAYLILVGEKIVGYCLFRDDKEYIYIRQLYIERDRRRRGLGRLCVQWLKTNLWPERKVRTEVLCHNENALSFWRKIGFADYCITLELK